MRRDPHAGYVPGRGCGCKLCQEPLPEVGAPNPLEAAMRGQFYESGRALDGVARVEPDAGVAVTIEPT